MLVALVAEETGVADKGPPPLRQVGIKALVGPLKEEKEKNP